MGFFDFLKNKTTTDNIKLEDVLLSDSMQKNMYFGITKIRTINDKIGNTPNQAEQKLMMNTIKSVYEDGKKITSYLESQGVKGMRIRSEILVTAFYFSVDLGLKDANNCNNNTIKEVFSLISFASAGVYLEPKDIPDIVVSQVKEIINWLISHPTS